MGQLHTQTMQVRHNFTNEERLNIADQQSAIINKIAELKSEKKVSASAYDSKIKQKEAELSEKTNAHILGYKIVDVLCYVRKNHETKRREFISTETGLEIYSEPFSRSDFHVQLSLLDADIKAKLGKAKYYGLLFLQETCVKAVEEFDFITFPDKTETSVLDEQRTKLIVLCIRHLEQKGLIENPDETVEFDRIFDMVNDWFSDLLSDFYTKPKIEDFPETKDLQFDASGVLIREEEKKSEIQKIAEREPKVEKPKKVETKKGKKGKKFEDEAEEEKEGDEVSDLPFEE